MATLSAPPRYSFVIPVLNEEQVLPALFVRLDAVTAGLDGPSELIFIDDGSSDSTAAILQRRCAQDARSRLILFSRNFGHQAAITAGFQAARGEAVIVIDADLQDPPEVVAELARKWREGYEIVYAERVERRGESRFKRWTAHLFYAALRRFTAVDIPANVGDFRLVDRKVVDAFLAMDERDRFVRGMFAWLGFRSCAVRYVRHERAAGTTKYPLWKMVHLAVSGVVSFSVAPLQLALWLGFAVSSVALLFGCYVVLTGLFGHHHWASGWASTIVVVSFLCGLNMMLTGVVGLYVGRIHTEVKRRPHYVVRDRANLAPAGEESLREHREEPSPWELDAPARLRRR